MNDDELESKIYNYFDNEVPEPNPQILEELKIQMHQKANTPAKKPSKKLRLALVSCIIVILFIPAITLPFMWDNLFPSNTSPSAPEEEIYYSDLKLTMHDLTTENLNAILVGEFSKYNTLIQDYTINLARGYYGEDNTLVYINIDMIKNSIPFTVTTINIVFVKNYTHAYSSFFDSVTEFTQYTNCKLYETIYKSGYKSQYYKFFEFDNHKVYLLQNKKDSSIINTIV